MEREYPWIYIENAFSKELAQKAFDRCIAETKDLPQRRVKVFGKPGFEPRLSQLYSIVEGHVYKYAGLKQVAKPFSDIPEFEELLVEIEKHMRDNGLHPQIFDTALVNHYRANTKDKVGAHSDKDGIEYPIASVSLGREARFFMYKKEDKKDMVEFQLKPNSLFIMLDDCNEKYQHEIKPYGVRQIKERPELSGARINITFRKQLEL